MASIRSYWLDTAGPEPAGIEPLPGDRTTEVAVIGGGYTGLAAAYRLAATHATDTVLLEAMRIGWGASGRNGGFAMMGMGKVPLAGRTLAAASNVVVTNTATDGQRMAGGRHGDDPGLQRHPHPGLLLAPAT